MKKKSIGSSFDGWLREEGIYDEVTGTAIKRVLARQVAAAMKEKDISKAEMARRMRTSRAALDRLLDPEYAAVTLATLRKNGGGGSCGWSFGRRDRSACGGLVSSERNRRKHILLQIRNFYYNRATSVCVGQANPSGQVLVQKTNQVSPNHRFARVWIVRCPRRGTYKANGCDFHIRKCPHEGSPGCRDDVS